jgi:beta-lactamase superfamily II metal-dependent hydrolase
VTTPASSTETPSLEVHILGGSKVESIILKLPDDRWGVVDCYSESTADSGANPTVRFLRGRGVESLFFVCLTHPHDDHYLGMSKLIEEFEPEEFWRFGCLGHEHVLKLLRYQELRARKAPEDEELSRSSQELNAVFDAVVERAVNRRTMRVCRANSQTNPYPKRSEPEGTYKIECLSPTGRQVERYERAIVSCIGPDGEIARVLPHSQHNDISLVLRITYGKTKVILGGDLETFGWQEVVEETGEPNLSACAVKVSHHGSETGYCERLWEHFSREGRPTAVVAPQYRYYLPRPNAR